MNYSFRRIISGNNRILLKSFNWSNSNYQYSKLSAFKRRMAENIKARENPIVKKIDSPEFHSIFSQELQTLHGLFKKYDYEIRIAGGAVRDLVLGYMPKDVDFATTATPEQMKKMFEAEGVRMVNMNGEKHGTITPRINDKENFEVTTLRIDVLTNGRHAEVEFTTDWQLDANRRDLTINSMFLDLDGSVYDYFFGYDDLLKRRVVFVGNADTRIKEDYLRILRYFRFYGRIAEKANNHDELTIKAIKGNVDGLEKISGERIWAELKKILEGNYSYDLVMKMKECGMFKWIGLPEDANMVEFKRVYDTIKHCNIPMNAITLISGLLHNPDDALKMHNRLKLSANERDLAFFLTQNRDDTRDVNELLNYQKICLDTIKSSAVLKLYVEQLLIYNNKLDLYVKLKEWQIPKLPVSGNCIREQYPNFTGQKIGTVLGNIRKYWADKNFKPTREEIIVALPEIVANSDFSKKSNSDNVKKQKTS